MPYTIAARRSRLGYVDGLIPGTDATNDRTQGAKATSPARSGKGGPPRLEGSWDA